MTQHTKNKPIAHTFSFYTKYYQPLVSLSDRTVLILIILLIVDALANPYAGLIYDARLYAVQALARIHPGLFSKDLFFMFGSQDSFSFFSSIHAWFIDSFDLYFGSWLLYQIIRVILYISILLFFRTLLDNNFLAFVCSLIIAAGPAHYLAFEINDAFLTPRIISVALALFGITKILKNDTISGILLIALAGLFHPLMTIGPGMLIILNWCYLRKFREIAVLCAGCLICFILIIILKDNPFSQINIFAHLDEKWRQILIEDGSCVIPGKWSGSDRSGIIGSLLICICSIRALPEKLQRITSFLVIISVFGITITLLSVYYFEWILPVQFQFWRAFWLLRLIIPAVGFVWAINLWNESKGYSLIAVPLIIISMITEGGVTDLTFPWIAVACGITTLQNFSFHSFFKKKYTNWHNAPSDNIKISGLLKAVLAIETLYFLLIIISIVFQHADFIEMTSVHAFLLSFTAVLGPLFRPFLLVVPCTVISFLAHKNRFVEPLLIPIFLYIIIPTQIPFFHYPSIVEINRPQSINESIVEKLNTWRTFIEPGSIIHTDGAIPVDLIWFHLHACGYVSRMQKGGIVFNRDLAIEFNQRKQKVLQFDTLNRTDELLNWSYENKIDYIITSRNLPLFRLGQLQNISLYSAK